MLFKYTIYDNENILYTEQSLSFKGCVRSNPESYQTWPDISPVNNVTIALDKEYSSLH